MIVSFGGKMCSYVLVCSLVSIIFTFQKVVCFLGASKIPYHHAQVTVKNFSVHRKHLVFLLFPMLL